ncbi:hypothetical protein AB9K26_06255 [Psychroserpens sp. XS_ASV72]|uniref:hypothetical protein n=1 Tax=Psychroserpens sp. XS_ASV72 TaxID=3241293 RepID=UPI0035137136
MKIRVFLILLSITLVNCKNEQTELDYKFSEKETFLKCDIENKKLFEEALYNFEDVITKGYPSSNDNLMYSYRQFTKESTRNMVSFHKIATPHSIDVFEALKNVDGLWYVNDANEYSLNYKHKIFDCIANNIVDNDLKTTFSALLNTNSMSYRMLKDLLLTYSNRMNSDKHLAMYVALELYYAKLNNVDPTKEDNSVEENIKQNTKVDPHAGHNHD